MALPVSWIWKDSSTRIPPDGYEFERRIFTGPPLVKGLNSGRQIVDYHSQMAAEKVTQYVLAKVADITGRRESLYFSRYEITKVPDKPNDWIFTVTPMRVLGDPTCTYEFSCLPNDRPFGSNSEWIDGAVAHISAWVLMLPGGK